MKTKWEKARDFPEGWRLIGADGRIVAVVDDHTAISSSCDAWDARTLPHIFLGAFVSVEAAKAAALKAVAAAESSTEREE